MIKTFIFLLLTLKSFVIEAKVFDCQPDEFKNSISHVVNQLIPYDDCKEARDDNGVLIGIRISKLNSTVSIGYGYKKDLSQSDLVTKNKKLTIHQLFDAIYSNTETLTNSYISSQKVKLCDAESYGVVNQKSHTSYFELNSELGAYRNLIYRVPKDSTDQYLVIGSGNKSIITHILFKKGD